MVGINFWAVVVAALAAFIASSTWYIVFSKQLMEAHAGDVAYLQNPPVANPPGWKKAVVYIQLFVLASVLAELISRLGITTWAGAALLGIGLWVGFVAVQWVGAMMWENVRLKLAAIHAGDWLGHIVVIVVIVMAWR